VRFALVCFLRRHFSPRCIFQTKGISFLY
jgi:hypothetical protein